MQLGYKYRVSFWVSLAERSHFGCDNIGIYFATSAIPQSNFNVINVTPAFATTQVILNDTGWVNIVDTITAMANYTHFCIGNFKDNANTNKLFYNPLPFNRIFNTAYYYIDDVSIMLIPDSITAQTLPAVCTGSPAALQANYPNTPPQTYQWFPTGQVFPGNSQYNLIYPQLPSPQTYWVVADWGNGCTSSDTTSIIVHPNVTVNAGADVTICQGLPYTLSATVSGGTS
ncbi:MAG: immunoglobulin domain-containing protein, partial [Bacteroidia bacterium]